MRWGCNFSDADSRCSMVCNWSATKTTALSTASHFSACCSHCYQHQGSTIWYSSRASRLSTCRELPSFSQGKCTERFDQARRPAKEREREAHQMQDKDRWKSSDVGSKIGSMERAYALDLELMAGRNAKLAWLRCTSHHGRESISFVNSGKHGLPKQRHVERTTVYCRITCMRWLGNAADEACMKAPISCIKGKARVTPEAEMCCRGPVGIEMMPRR